MQPAALSTELEINKSLRSRKRRAETLPVHRRLRPVIDRALRCRAMFGFGLAHLARHCRDGSVAPVAPNMSETKASCC
jgi:hypothetical protein